MSDCKGKKKGPLMATYEQKKKRKLYCKIYRISGSHNTENHKDKDKDNEKEEKEFGGHVSHRVYQSRWKIIMEFILQILNWLNSVTQVEYVCMAKFEPVDKHDFDNWLLDSGSSAHMNLHREDLEKL